MLSALEITRYSRNILLSEVGRKGQEKLKDSVVRQRCSEQNEHSAQSHGRYEDRRGDELVAETYAWHEKQR